MLNAISVSAFVVGALGALFVVARHARKSGVSPEWARKIVHIGMGLVCLTFPWMFSSVVPVVVLATCAAGALLLVRLVPRLRASFGCALHAVERHSYGEFAFIAGVASTFALAHGNALAYVVPVAILTFADAFAALIGTRYGKRKFTCFDGWKSFEGSAAFFIVAFACVAIPLIIGNFPSAIFIAFILGAVLMVVEAASWAGIDNFAIPIVGELLLRGLGAGLGVAL